MQKAVTLDVIVLSFEDERILRAIQSIKDFDDLGIVRIIVIDGGSSPDLVNDIRALVGDAGIVVSEKDKGIFDALNKGLDLVESDWIGWMGSDDYYAPEFKASYLAGLLEANDLVVGDLVHFSNGRSTRKSYSWPAARGLVKYGFNNPHFSTFGRAELLKSEAFQIDLPVADIEYFLKVFEKAESVASIPEVFVYAEEGGFSNQSLKHILRLNIINAGLYSKFLPLGFLIVFVKLAYKVATKLSRSHEVPGIELH